MMDFMRRLDWAALWQRLVWSTVGVVALGITIWLCRDMAHTMPVIFALLVLAACVEELGFAYARHVGRQGNRLAAAAAFWVTIVCMAVLLVSETAYWSSSIDGIQEQIARERTIREGQDLVIEKRKERYARLTAGETPDQIRAQIDKAMLDPIYVRSKQCAEATLPDSLKLCGDITDLRKRLADAEEARRLEGKLLEAGTSTEVAIKRNFYATAEVASKLTGLSVEFWVIAIVFLFVVAVQSLRVLPFYIGWAPSPPRVRQEAASRGLTVNLTARDELSAFSPALPAQTPPTGSGGGRRAGTALGDAGKRVTASTPVSEMPAPPPAAEKPPLTVVRSDLKTPAEIAKAWVADFAPAGSGRRAVSAANARWQHRQWCQRVKATPLSKQGLGKALKEIGVVISRSSGKGSTYIFNPLELSEQPAVAEPARRAA